VSFAVVTFCVASQRVFIVVVNFVIDSFLTLLDTSAYSHNPHNEISCHECPLDIPLCPNVHPNPHMYYPRTSQQGITS